MATTQTALRRMRDICLSLPETDEAEHFGVACFRVKKRMFATCGEKKGVCQLIFQLESEHARRLVASDPRFEPYARQADGVVIDAADVTDWDAVRALVLESYHLNEPANRPPKRARRAVLRKGVKKRSGASRG